MCIFVHFYILQSIETIKNIAKTPFKFASLAPEM